MNIKKSVRLTRRSYRRKLIMFGVSIFMSLALTATGFAAWVLSKDTQKEASGAVEIGAVAEASVEISDISFIADNDKQVNPDHFIFEPLEIDTTGRVRYDGESQPENLDVKFTWTVKNFEIVGELYVDFKVPATVYTAIEKGWLALPNTFELLDGIEKIKNDKNADVDYKVLRYKIHNADTKITNNLELSEDKVLSYKVTKEGDVITEVEFTMNIPFAWGEEFDKDGEADTNINDNLNPGIYYDTPFPEKPAKGTGVPYETVKATLNEFKASLHGIEYNETFEKLSEEDKDTLYAEKPIEKYLIVINAKVA